MFILIGYMHRINNKQRNLYYNLRSTLKSLEVRLDKPELRDHMSYVTFIVYSPERSLKVAYTSGQFFEKNMKRYPIFSLQINYHQTDKMYK